MATPVRTIDATITEVVKTTREVPVRYWQFEMETGSERVDYGSYDPETGYKRLGFDWGEAADYFLVTREEQRPGKPTRLWADFYEVESEALDDMRVEYEDSYGDTVTRGDGDHADLSVPWTIFAAAARRILAGAKTANMPDDGGFSPDPDSEDAIIYTTRCGQKYRLTRATLEGLLA